MLFLRLLLDAPYLLITVPLILDTTIGFTKKHLPLFKLPSIIYWLVLGIILAVGLLFMLLATRNFVYFQF